MTVERCVDETALARLRKIGGDRFLAQMIDLFLDHGAKMVAAARQAQRGGDLTTVERSVHSLKSSAGNLGAETVHTLAVRIEQLARANQFDAVATAVEELDAAFAQTRDTLQQYRQTLTP
jgi:HPt (histidine-containing phosphotransfer) domain-containing protein